CGFAVTVLDNRAKWASPDQHPHASKLVECDFNNADTYIAHPETAFAVIMTSGHKFDENVLKSLAPLPLKYLGMMGSQNKVKQVFQNLITQNISSKQLARVHAPIGLPIGSHTPWEIAISICGELVKVRNI
ncbi:MAG: XdhC family protein, partial [Candidatus Cloacimonetes bacterium]|nr:XdhC family protein [Candidatus Cloacimonadota bacterium]